MVRTERWRHIGRDRRVAVGIDGRVPGRWGRWEGLVAGLAGPRQEPVEEEDDRRSEEDEDDDAVDEAIAWWKEVAMLYGRVVDWKQVINRKRSFKVIQLW